MAARHGGWEGGQLGSTQLHDLKFLKPGLPGCQPKGKGRGGAELECIMIHGPCAVPEALAGHRFKCANQCIRHEVAALRQLRSLLGQAKTRRTSTEGETVILNAPLGSADPATGSRLRYSEAAENRGAGGCLSAGKGLRGGLACEPARCLHEPFPEFTRLIRRVTARVDMRCDLKLYFTRVVLSNV